MAEYITNSKFAKDNAEFKKACDAVDLNPTQRQASKWRNKRGKAYQYHTNTLK